MKTENPTSMESQIEHDSPSPDEGLVLRVVRIKNNQPNGALPSNSCDNCNPWTSCCDSY